MGRKYTNKAHKHFTYNKIENTTECIICKMSLKGNHGTNLKKHLMRNHEFKEDYFTDCSSNKCKKVNNILQNKQRTIQQRLNEMNTITLNMMRKDFENNCVELVTVNGRPFSILDDSGFQNIINPIKCAIEEKNKHKFSISSESIQKKVSEEADRIRKEISEDITQILISLKVDAVTRLDRSFLGLNIQYIKGTKIILRTLALKELQEKHTGEYIKTIIKNVCSSFNISLDQIYSITTDNGANMLKAVKILTYEDCDNDVLEENENNIDCDSEENEEYGINNLNVFENINVIENVNFNLETSILTNLTLTGIRCAAHTLQLAVDDALKRTKPITQLISKARNLAKKLRTQTFIYLIRKQNFKKPTLDCPTRWCSTIDMLENLLRLKDYCEELSVTKFQNFVTLKDDEWSKIEEICKALRPSKICTKRLQKEQLTLSEFFGLWFETKVATEAVQTPFSKLIVEQMSYREEKLINNDILLSAVYMDPRYKVLLDNTQVQRAKIHLKHLWVKIVNRSRTDNSMNQSNENFNGNSSNSSGTSSSYDEFENLLKLKEQQHSLINLSSRETDLHLHRVENELERYNNEQKRINRRINVLEFWEENKHDQHELYKLAMIVLAVPATQVSVERLFSGLKFILSPLRTNVSEHILENQLLVRANRIFCNKEETKSHIKEKRSLTFIDSNECTVSKRSKINTNSEFNKEANIKEKECLVINKEREKENNFSRKDENNEQVTK